MDMDTDIHMDIDTPITTDMDMDTPITTEMEAKESPLSFLHGSYPKDSNPQPFAPLGSAPAPRAPRVLPR